MVGRWNILLRWPIFQVPTVCFKEGILVFGHSETTRSRRPKKTRTNLVPFFWYADLKLSGCQIILSHTHVLLGWVEFPYIGSTGLVYVYLPCTVALRCFFRGSHVTCQTHLIGLGSRKVDFSMDFFVSNPVSPALPPWLVCFGTTFFAGPPRPIVAYNKKGLLVGTSWWWIPWYKGRNHLLQQIQEWFFTSLRLLGMSWGVKTTCLEAPGVSLGGSGVSIGGVGSLRVRHI